MSSLKVGDHVTVKDLNSKHYEKRGVVVSIEGLFGDLVVVQFGHSKETFPGDNLRHFSETVAPQIRPEHTPVLCFQH